MYERATSPRSGEDIDVRVVLPDRVKNLVSGLSGAEVVWYSDDDSCLAALPGAEVLWVDFTVNDISRAIEVGADLKWLTTHFTGVESWPLALIQKRGLLLTNGAGVGAIPISEYLVMGLLAGLKGLPDLVRAQDRREWLKRPPSRAELHGKRALIYGYGGIGRAIADRLRPFGVTVTGVRRNPGDEPGVIPVTAWEARLPETDLLILSVPLTGETRALVGEAQLAALPKGAWVANIARGGLIDESALVASLKSGHLGGAYLDVTDREPLPPESELWSIPNLILTPHSSWATDRQLERGAEIFLDNFARYQRGEALRSVVDLRAGY
jgi:phosphoglycerate dehydrogenase-like enzyme